MAVTLAIVACVTLQRPFSQRPSSDLSCSSTAPNLKRLNRTEIRLLHYFVLTLCRLAVVNAGKGCRVEDHFNGRCFLCFLLRLVLMCCCWLLCFDGNLLSTSRLAWLFDTRHIFSPK